MKSRQKARLILCSVISINRWQQMLLPIKQRREMSDKPRLLDLFCGAGGAAMGYSRAGFEVVGVDIEPQPNYPFEFIQCDVMEFPLHAAIFTRDIDAIHASPPCQSYSRAMRHLAFPQPMLLDETRELLESTGLPYVIE